MNGISIKGILWGLVLTFALDIVIGVALFGVHGGFTTINLPEPEQVKAIRSLTHSTSYLAYAMFFGLLTTTAGGYLAARFAGQRKYLNSAWIGVVGVILGLIIGGDLPLWFRVTAFIFTIPVALLGGYISKGAPLRPAKATGNEPKGIGGWLLLPAVGLIIMPFSLAYQFHQDILPALAPETWNTLTNTGSPAYHPLWGVAIVFEVVANVGLFCFTLWLLVLFFKKSKKIPKLVIIWLLATAVVQIFDLLLTRQIPLIASHPVSMDTVKNIGRSIVGIAIWVPYFLRSRRVKNTFVESASKQDSPSSSLRSINQP